MTFVPPMTVVPSASEWFELVLVASDCDAPTAEATPATTPATSAGRGGNGGRSSRPDWRLLISRRADCQTFLS